MSERLPGNRELRVLVIGGGIGGLCLAQGLRPLEDVDVVVFERAASPVPDRQGYGFTINHDGDHALRECLPPRLYELYRATSCPAPTGDFVLFSSGLEVIFRKPLPHVPGVTVNRQTLRELLLAGLGPAVRFGKELARYETRPDGRVTAYFADGTQETGDLLAGADGTNSVVRGQLIPGAEFDDFGWSIYGKTPLTAELRTVIPPEFLTGMPRAKDDRGLTLGVGSFVKPGPFEAVVTRFAPDARLSPCPDYLRWTLSFRDASEPEQQFRASSGTRLHQIAADLVASWHPVLRAVIEQADGQTTFPFGISCARPVPPWDEPAVTVLGDAIHTMTPGRGEGASIALRDAALMTSRLHEARSGRISLMDAKREYEAEMLRYGFAATASSARPYFAGAMHRRPR